MSHKQIMPFEIFNYYISILQKENDWLDNLYQNQLADFASNIFSYDCALDLLSYIFRDNSDILNQWIYECDYGRSENTVITYNNKEYKDIKEIYELLCETMNNGYLPDINIKREQ